MGDSHATLKAWENASGKLAEAARHLPKLQHRRFGAGLSACNCSSFGPQGIPKGENGFAPGWKPCGGAEPCRPLAVPGGIGNSGAPCRPIGTPFA